MSYVSLLFLGDFQFKESDTTGEYHQSLIDCWNFKQA